MKRNKTLIDYEKNQEFIECECHGHGILVTEFIDIFPDKRKNQEFWLAMFSCGQFHSKPSIWRRLKFAWWHLKTGKYYEDEIIISPENTKKLIKFLQKRIDKFKK